MEIDEATFEETLRAAFAAGALDEVAARLLQRHGPALLAFLRDRLRSESEAQEVYAQFSEDLWCGLPAFQFRASLRSWAFTLARNAAARHLRDPRRRRANNQALPDDSRLEPPALELRSGTPPHRQTQMKERLRALRRHLPEEDQTLLVLRVDQKFSWLELLDVLSPTVNLGAHAQPRASTTALGEERDRELARLRQRFKRAKDQLRKLAEAEGLLAPK